MTDIESWIPADFWPWACLALLIAVVWLSIALIFDIPPSFLRN